VRTEVQHHLLLTAAQDHRVCQRRHSRGDFDRSATGVVEHTPFECPSVHVPDPAGDGAVYEGGPAEHENHHWDKTATLSDGADNNGACHAGELHLFCLVCSVDFHGEGASYLVKSIQKVRNERGARRRSSQCLHETEFLEISNVSICRILAECQRVSPEIPLEGDDGQRHHTRPDQRQGRLSAGETRVEETKTRHHYQHHRGRDDDVGLVTRRVPLVQILNIYIMY
jgi:hypothetical protein